MERIRLWVQCLWFFLTNGYWAFPFTKNIYQGPLKVICAPGLNCASCPASTTFCLLGGLQHMLAMVRQSWEIGTYYIGLYALGCMGLLGTVFGRFICGWGCPFGLVQDFLHKIPSRKYSVPTWLRPVKYFFLLFFVVLLPLMVVNKYGFGQQWFCKYVCPSGTLGAGIPMMMLQPELRSSIGILFYSKVMILVSFVGWSIVSRRPFCQTSCPLGAFYSLFSRYQLVRMRLNREACTDCGACHSVCPMEVRFNETPNSGACINCLQCMQEACKFGAISVELAGYPLFVGGAAKRRPRPLRNVEQHPLP